MQKLSVRRHNKTFVNTSGLRRLRPGVMADAPVVAIRCMLCLEDGRVLLVLRVPLPHPALDALDVRDRLHPPLASWWQQHEEWRGAFPPFTLDEADKMRPRGPPTLGKLKIGNPSQRDRGTTEQRDAFHEAAEAHELAYAEWEQKNTKRKGRKRPAADGAQATARRAKKPEFLARHAERERPHYEDRGSSAGEEDEAEERAEAIAPAAMPAPEI